MRTTPATSVRFDQAAFDRLKQRVKHMAASRRGQEADPAYAAAVPAQIGIKLNNGCNLRCAHCYEWASFGYHQNMTKTERKDEVPLSVIEKVLHATRGTNAKLYLWGGEPLMYSRFDELMDMLKENPRWTTICTNAILTERHLEAMLGTSSCLAFLASVDGLRDENDLVRGKGTFDKVVDALSLLLERRRAGDYKGAISVSLTINDAVIGGLPAFVEHFEALGVDSIYLVFPWYIPMAVAAQMDAFVRLKLPEVSAHIDKFRAASWHSFDYHVSPERTDRLIRDMEEINGRIWHTRVRFHPAVRPDEVSDFVAGKPVPAEGKTRCLAITNRIDILPGGDVTSCKFFPELKVGNLSTNSVESVWKSGAFEQVRRTIAGGLSPVCSKCTLLYSTG